MQDMLLPALCCRLGTPVERTPGFIHALSMHLEQHLPAPAATPARGQTQDPLGAFVDQRPLASEEPERRRRPRCLEPWGRGRWQAGAGATLLHQSCEVDAEAQFETYGAAWEKGAQGTENEATFENQPAFSERGQGPTSEDVIGVMFCTTRVLTCLSL